MANGRNHILLRLMLLPAALLALFACDKIHTFPEPGKEVDPTEIRSLIKVKCNLELKVAEVVTKSAAPVDPSEEIPSKYDRRYFVEIRSTGAADTLVQGFTFIRESNDTSALVIDTELHALRYNIYVWTDFVLKGTAEDLYYDTGNGSKLNAVHIPSSATYVAGTDYKNTQTAIVPLNLVPYAEEWFIELTIPVQLGSPMAKITLLANDLAEYASTAGITIPLKDLAAQMKETVSYNGYLPTGFNVYTGRLNDSEVGFSFQFAGRYPYEFREESYTVVGSDYVFVNGESSSVTISVKIVNKDGKVVNEVGDVLVPIYKGKETVVIYKFFTKEYAPGIGIDPGFDGEFNVYV